MEVYNQIPSSGTSAGQQTKIKSLTLNTRLSDFLSQTEQERYERLLGVEKAVGDAIDLVQLAMANLATSNHNLEYAYSHLSEYFSHITSVNKCTKDYLDSKEKENESSKSDPKLDPDNDV